MDSNGSVQPAFRKSSRSAAANNNCVELASVPDHVLIRDSKNPHGGVLRLSKASARRLLDEVRRS
jgi:hypothetical protein